MTGARRARPHVTVVVPTRDRHELVGTAVASARRQSGVTVEVIVVDDGSSTPVVLDTDDAVRVIRHDGGRGVSAARNTGLAAATGEFTTFLDDDDLLLPGMLSRAVAPMLSGDGRQRIATLSTLEVVSTAGEVLEVRVPADVERGARYGFGEPPAGRNWKVHNSLVARTELLERLGGFDPELPANEHDDLFLRLTRVAGIVAVEEAGYRLVDHGGDRLSHHWADRATGKRRTLVKHRELYASDRRELARQARSASYDFERAGDASSAVRMALVAVRAHPDGRSLARLARSCQTRLDPRR